MIETMPTLPATETILPLFEAQKRHAIQLRREKIAARKERLTRLRQWIMANRPKIQQALYADFRKPSLEVDATEIFPVITEISLAKSSLQKWTRPKPVDTPLTMIGSRAHIQYEPKGVCLIIAPWNYPFNLCIGPLVSALAAGNAVILKPSELTPNTSAVLRQLCVDLFDPKEVTLIEGGPEVSQYLLSLPFDHIFFTGSPAIGKVVMRAAAEHLTSVTLELGGKSPVIVTPTANLNDAATRIAVAKFINKGQTCIAPDYVLVHESIASALIEKLKEKTMGMFSEAGKPMQESPHYARIVNEKHFRRVKGIIEDALANGARLHMQPDYDEAYCFIHPVILTGVNMESRVMEEEIFGPVLPVLTYSNLEDAIELINHKPKPLALYVFSSDSAESRHVLQATTSGTACINDCAIQFLHHNLPFGGVNNSGIGKAHGYFGFLAFSNEKPVLKQRSGFTSVKSLYPPYKKSSQVMMDWLLRLS
jgi:aldehyde dehydrogenase (NAD+)